MTTSNLLRWGGLAALAGGVLIVTAIVRSATVDYENLAELLICPQALVLLGSGLMLLGLVGLYVSRRRPQGPWG